MQTSSAAQPHRCPCAAPCAASPGGTASLPHQTTAPDVRPLWRKERKIYLLGLAPAMDGRFYSRIKRSDLYIVAPIALHVAEHFEIRRLCDKDGRNKIGNQFVAELMDELLQKGWLVAGKTSHGEGIRTATNKERGIPRQPTEQVDGQITMESQKHKASKKRKPPDPSR